MRLGTIAKRLGFEGARVVGRVTNRMDLREVPANELPGAIERWKEILKKSKDSVELEHTRVCLERVRKL